MTLSQLVSRVGTADTCFCTRPSIRRILNFRRSVSLLFDNDQYIIMKLWIAMLSKLLE
jgi:hypothetical protein